MHHLTRLFRLLEITRAMPQYGYVLAEIPKSDLSDLAQHHYLVTFVAWQLGRLALAAGCQIDLAKILEISLVHDLGELFGGDISLPYSIANPAARKIAKQFEAENQKYIATLFEGDQEYVQQLADESMTPTSTEALIAKLADYIEVTQYKLYVHRLSKGDVEMVMSRLRDLAAQIPDKKISKAMADFLETWAKDLSGGNLPELFESAKA